MSTIAQSNSTPNAPLRRRTMVYYGLSDMPIQVAAIPIAAFLPNFYNQDLGVSLEAVGLVWLLTRMFDAISDPLIGWLSDHTNTRWGRRRVWMAAAVPIFMLAVYKLFMPTEPVDATYLLFWLVVFWTGWTMLFIPYYAWAAELSSDYNERTLIAGWRAWMGMAANVTSKLVPVIALTFFAYEGTRETLFLIGIMTLILLPFCVGMTIFNVPEPKNYLPSRVPLITGLKFMWGNAPFKRLVLAFFINQLGSAISTALVVFFIRNVLQEEGNSITMLLVYYLANLCGIPFWVRMSAKVSKHKAWCCALALFGFFQCAYLFLGAGDFYYMLPFTACTGFLGGSFYALPNAMKADVIDVDTLASGEDRAAWYFAVWSFTTKVALSIGPALALWVLVGIGFETGPGVVPTQEGLWGLQLFFVLGPAIGFWLTALIVWNHPLTPQRHAEIRTQLEGLRSQRSSE